MKELGRADVFRALPPGQLPWVRRVVRAAEDLRVGLFLVGGPVRDLLLEIPLRDVDFCVRPRGRHGAEAVANRAVGERARVVVHARFGTVCIEAGGVRIDLADLRQESYAHPGALPRTEPGELEQDLLRRDFTVNALALPIVGESRELVAAPGALEDLRGKRLRILHEQSFHDDPTRALRAARLGSRLGFALARGSRTSLRDALRDGVFGRVSGERLRREIDKVFEDAALGLDPSKALRKLAEWHVLAALEPGLELPRESVAPLRRLGRAVAQRPWSGPSFRAGVVGLSVWLAPLAPAMRRRFVRRLSLRGGAARQILGFPKLRDELLRKLAKARGRGAVDAVLAEIDEEGLLALHVWAPATLRRRIERWAAEDRVRRVPVSGNDLLEIGLSGPELGAALSRIRGAFLDGAVANREEALALARELSRSKSTRGSSRKPARGRRLPRRG